MFQKVKPEDKVYSILMSLVKDDFHGGLVGHVTTQSTADFHVTTVSPPVTHSNIGYPETVQYPNLIPNKPATNGLVDSYGAPINGHSNDVQVQYHGDYGLKSPIYKRNAKKLESRAGTPAPNYLVANEQTYKKNLQKFKQENPQSHQYQAVVKRNIRKEEAGQETPEAQPIPDFLVANIDAFNEEYDKNQEDKHFQSFER